MIICNEIELIEVNSDALSICMRCVLLGRGQVDYWISSSGIKFDGLGIRKYAVGKGRVIRAIFVGEEDAYSSLLLECKGFPQELTPRGGTLFARNNSGPKIYEVAGAFGRVDPLRLSDAIRTLGFPVEVASWDQLIGRGN